jgi:hypothetical protein
VTRLGPPFARALSGPAAAPTTCECECYSVVDVEFWGWQIPADDLGWALRLAVTFGGNGGLEIAVLLRQARQLRRRAQLARKEDAVIRRKAAALRASRLQ